MTRVCIRCGEEKDMSGFGRKAQYKDGIARICRVCNAKWVADWSKLHPERVRAHRDAITDGRRNAPPEKKLRILTQKHEYNRREREVIAARARAKGRAGFYKEKSRKRYKRYLDGDPKEVARYALRGAVAKGTIYKPSSCSKCGATGRITAHHEDYSKPLDVVWLCNLCHMERHRPAAEKALREIINGNRKQG